MWFNLQFLNSQLNNPKRIVFKEVYKNKIIIYVATKLLQFKSINYSILEEAICENLNYKIQHKIKLKKFIKYHFIDSGIAIISGDNITLINKNKLKNMSNTFTIK